MKNGLIWMLILFFVIACSDKSKMNLLEIDSISDITYSTAIINCNVAEKDGYLPSSSGIFFTKSKVVTENDNKVSAIGINEDSRFALRNLEPNTTYFIRAFTELDGIYSLSDETNFTTSDVTYFTDERDGNVYPVLSYSDEMWLGENLRFEIDGESYPIETEFQDDLAKFGQLYTFEVAKDVCPDGWHLPSDEEWMNLERTIGLPQDQLDVMYDFRGDIGLKMIYPGPESWYYISPVFTNSSGFNAYRTGGRWDNGKRYIGYGVFTYFWTSTVNDTEVIIRELNRSYEGIARYFTTPDRYCSVRCIKD